MSGPVRIDAPGASAEEVAAIAAAVTAIVAAGGAAAAGAPEPDRLDAWVRASRLGSRNAGMARGSWRLSGRIDRRQR